MFHNPSIEEIKNILADTKTIAVVGLSPKPKRPSHQVSKAMQGFGYRIIPVRPMAEEILGEKVFADLEAIPAGLRSTIDVVDVFRAGDKIAPIIDACIAAKVPVIWLQDGVVNEAEARRAQAAGITVIMDRCIYRDYVRLLSVET
jgi:uncharacterized protein